MMFHVYALFYFFCLVKLSLFVCLMWDVIMYPFLHTMSLSSSKGGPKVKTHTKTNLMATHPSRILTLTWRYTYLEFLVRCPGPWCISGLFYYRNQSNFIRFIEFFLPISSLFPIIFRTI